MLRPPPPPTGPPASPTPSWRSTSCPTRSQSSRPRCTERTSTPSLTRPLSSRIFPTCKYSFFFHRHFSFPPFSTPGKNAACLSGLFPFLNLTSTQVVDWERPAAKFVQALSWRVLSLSSRARNYKKFFLDCSTTVTVVDGPVTVWKDCYGFGFCSSANFHLLKGVYVWAGIPLISAASRTHTRKVGRERLAQQYNFEVELLWRHFARAVHFRYFLIFSIKKMIFLQVL